MKTLFIAATCGFGSGSRRDANHGRANDAALKNVSGLQLSGHGALGMFGGLDAFDGVVGVRIEILADGFHALETLF